MLETKEEKIKLGVAVGVFLIAAIVIAMQFMSSGPKAGEVTGTPTVTAPEPGAPEEAPTQGGRRLAPGVNPSGS